MTCQELTDFLDEYLEGSLEPAIRSAFERHLGVCVDCRNYLDSYRRAIEISRVALRRAEEVESSGVPESLIQAILVARREMK